MYDSPAIFKSHKSTRQKQKVQTVLDERAPQLILVIQIISKFRKAAGDVSDKNETSDLRSPVVYKDFSGVCIKFGQMTEQTNNKVPLLQVETGSCQTDGAAGVALDILQGGWCGSGQVWSEMCFMIYK